MRSVCSWHFQLAIYGRPKWWKVFFWRINHYMFCWLCCRVGCCMLQNMDHMEASCNFYVKVDTFDQLEKSIICVLTITKLGIMMLTTQYDLIVTFCLKSAPRDFFRQTSPDFRSVDEYPVCIIHTGHFCCHPSPYIPVTMEYIGKTNYKLRDHLKPLRPAAIHSWIHHE